MTVEATIVEEATSMMGLVGTPAGFITGVLLTAANAAIRRNGPRVQQSNAVLAVATSFMAFLMSAVLTGVMTSIAVRSVRGSGGVEGVLVLYWLAYLTALGVAVYALYVVWRALLELRRTHRATAR